MSIYEYISQTIQQVWYYKISTWWDYYSNNNKITTILRPIKILRPSQPVKKVPNKIIICNQGILKRIQAANQAA